MKSPGFWQKTYKKRVLALATYSAIGLAIVISATISPIGDKLGLALGLGALVGLAAAGFLSRSHYIARAALFSTGWALIYGLKAVGAPLLEIPVYLAMGGLCLAIACRQDHIPGLRPSIFPSGVGARWHVWRSHFKTTALLTMAFAALSVSLFWLVEGAGIDNILPIAVTIGLATLGAKYASRLRQSTDRVAKRLQGTIPSAPAFLYSTFWAFFIATILFSLGILIHSGSHQGVVRAMNSNRDDTSHWEDTDFTGLEHSSLDSVNYRTHADGLHSPILPHSFESFTTNPGKEDCLLYDTGVRYCDPVNLVFLGQTLEDVKLSLLAAGWINSTRRGSDQFLRSQTQGFRQQDLQLLFYESLRSRYHVRLWDVPGQMMVVGAVHHEEGVYHHKIDMDWDEAQRFVEKQFCGDECGTSELLSNLSFVQGDTESWRGLANDGRAALISAPE